MNSKKLLITPMVTKIGFNTYLVTQGSMSFWMKSQANNTSARHTGERDYGPGGQAMLALDTMAIKL